MKVKHIIFTILLFLIMNVNVYAYCDRSDILRVKGEANRIEVDIKKLKTSEGKYTGSFRVIINGLTSEMSIKDVNSDISYSYNDVISDVLTIDNITGTTLKLKVYYDRCSSNLVRTIEYRLPVYNIYSENELCEGLNEEVTVCDPWYQGEVNEELIKEEVSKYKDSNKNLDITKGSSEIIEFLSNYYLYIIISIILIVTIIVILIVRKKRGELD